ncbi:DUF4870 domain-containing protein [Candidatus Sumerlaeota bacterium]|nr:DUF4870 domain-containing protein [Candidatus Sumerlaeota bacterium]
MRRRYELDMAALCHLCNAIPIWGLLFCGLIWFNSREKSRYLVAQAQQAMVFHGLLLFLIVVWMLVEIASKLLFFFLPPVGALLSLLNRGIISVVLVIYIGFCLLGSWRCFTSSPFRYPFIGERGE